MDRLAWQMVGVNEPGLSTVSWIWDISVSKEKKQFDGAPCDTQCPSKTLRQVEERPRAAASAERGGRCCFFFWINSWGHNRGTWMHGPSEDGGSSLEPPLQKEPVNILEGNRFPTGQH